MNEQELVDAVAAKTGGNKAATGEAIDAVISAITGELTKGKTVQLIGFGSFSTGARRHDRRVFGGQGVQGCG
jgi:DNA-binding protein HU-beta